MNLDLPTLMTMESFVAACAGVLLIAAWWQNRQIPALALWGFGHAAAAGGVFSIMLGATLRQPSWSIAGGALLALAPGLQWKGARALDGGPASWPLALFGVVVVPGLAGAVPGLGAFAGSLNLGVGAGYLFVAAFALWLARKERLPARLPLVILTALHAEVMSIGAFSTFMDPLSQYKMPPLTSFFGFIHFESIVFAVGTAVFLLALVKERSEAVSRAAASIDPLTGIANRAAFMASGERILERCRREGAPVCAMMFDLDRFKAINDTHGHAVGDAVIRKFCEVAGAALRPSEVFGRIGGEEFAVVLPGSSVEAAAVRAERIRASFASSCRLVGDRQVNATVSGGVSTSVNGEHALPALLEHSDAALYCAKADGRNCVRREDRSMSKSAVSKVVRVA